MLWKTAKTRRVLLFRKTIRSNISFTLIIELFWGFKIARFEFKVTVHYGLWAILEYCFSSLGWSRSVRGFFFSFFFCDSSIHHFRAKCWPNRIICNSTSRHFDIRYWHAELSATQHVIILKQNVEMPSCLQLNMSSFSNKMWRCRVHSNSASRHVETKCWDT